jgi:broad specificity phosphatase PhoE
VSDRVRVWCLRHAEASHTTAGIAGAVPTAPLTMRGHHQALAAAQQLAGEPLARIYSSTALRARQTAGLLAAGSTVDVVALPELDEVGVGAHMLRAWIVQQQLGRRAAGGETGQQVVARVAAAFGPSTVPIVRCVRDALGLSY